MNGIGQDIRYALRQLLKNPGFTLVAVLTLAIGIGANTAIFSVVNSVILRPLPYPQPERILEFGFIDQGEFGPQGASYNGFKFLQEQSRVFAHVAGATGSGVNLSGGAASERMRKESVSADFFKVFGVGPVVGRDFQAEEDQGGGERVAILSNGLWKRRFGSDRSAIGQAIMLDGAPFTVIGVMPAGFQTVEATDVWTPLSLVAKTAGGGGNITVLGRLREGVTPQQASAQIATLSEEWRKQFPLWYQKGRLLGVEPYQKIVVSDVRNPLLILFGAITFVLLIACANIANLLMTRATARSKEMAIRLSLGSSRGRLIRQLLTESVLLALCGGVLGLLIARWGLDALLALTPTDLPHAGEIGLDAWALAFTLVAAVGTGLLFGLAPALQASRIGPHDALKETSGRSTSGTRQRRLRSALVMGEVALSLSLLAGAALLIRTFANLVHTNAGFDVAKTLAIEIWSTSRHNDPLETSNYYREITRRINAIPGVEDSGVVAAGLPLKRGGNTAVSLASREGLIGPDYREVTPGFFHALGIPLRQGRYFTESDSTQAARVIIVNESFAKRYYTNRSALGAQINMGGKGGDYREIVGVVGDVKSFLDRPAPRTVFIPAAQASSNATKLFGTWFPVHVVVRTAGDPLSLSHAIEEQVRAADPDVPIGRVRSMKQALSFSIAFQSFMMVLLGIFAGLALLLAAIGIYGVMAYSVAQRTHEIGIRMALGAQRRDVFRLIVGQGMMVTLLGIALGIAGGLGATRVLADMLFGVKPTDPWTFAGVSAVLLGVALLACYLPARRAMRVDPVVALRYE